MNDPHDNALDDKAALEKYGTQSDTISDVAVGDVELSGPPPDRDGWRPASTTPDHDAMTGEVFPKDDRIEDEAGLMRAFASLRRANLALAQNKRLQTPVLGEARRELAALEERCAKANAALEARAEHHRNRIEVYARTHRDELVQGKRKTRDFGIGSVSFKKAGGEYRWRKDMKPAEREAVLLAWASGRRGCTRSVEVVDLAEVKKYLAWAREEAKNNSEAPPTPPGLEYVPEHEELKIETGLEAKEEK